MQVSNMHVELNPDYLKDLHCSVISTVKQEDDLEEWLRVRSLGIGGSDVGTIAGVNKYSSPRLLYLKKTGQYEETFDSAAEERMYFGHVLEPIVASEFSRRENMIVAEAPGTFVSNDEDWALANIDRFVLDENGMPIGILECKTSSEYLNNDWKDADFPMQYIYQVQWYMYVTGLRKAWIAAIVGGNKFYSFEITYNEALVEQMIAETKEFWFTNVGNLVEPDWIGLECEKDYLGEVYKAEAGTELILADLKWDGHVEAIREIKAQIKALEQTKRYHEHQIKEEMKENETAITQSFTVTWKTKQQNRIDSKRLKAEAPDIAAQYMKTITFREMRTK